MNKALCGCCEGIERLTPLSVANRPGLPALVYRAGTHAAFLTTMKARLSGLYLEPPSDKGAGEGQRLYPLSALTTRDASDPAIALLDAWSTVADVLTFYQERIANEGYLRTATERRSILELARLVGYGPRPGVAASVYLAFTLEDGYEVEIPAGTRAQSVPGPGELPQAFETAGPLMARTAWNALEPRATQPQKILEPSTDTLYFEGVSTNLAPNDPLLIANRISGERIVARVQDVEPQNEEDRTKVTLQETVGASMAARFAAATRDTAALYRASAPSGAAARQVVAILDELYAWSGRDAGDMAALLHDEVLPRLRGMYAGMPDRFRTVKPWLGGAIDELEKCLKLMPGLATGAGGTVGQGRQAWSKTQVTTPPARKIVGSALAPVKQHDLVSAVGQPPSIQPANALRLPRSVAQTFDIKGDTALQIVASTVYPEAESFYQAVENADVTPPNPVEVYAFRATTSLFGHNADKEPKFEDGDDVVLRSSSEWENWALAPDEQPNRLFLESEQEGILPGSHVLVQYPADGDGFAAFNTDSFVVDQAVTRSRAEYNLNSRTTVITLGEDWWQPRKGDKADSQADFARFIRGTTVHAESEPLALAGEPIDDPVAGDEIELGEFYPGLEPGAWLIISGERDIPGTSGVMASELTMLAGVSQGYDLALPGDKPHTTLLLANHLSYSYVRDTVTIYGNVTKATHGETREQILGSGDASKALQQFDLSQSPLTYLPAPTPAGVVGTLQVRINGVLWHEADSLVGLGPTDRGYVTRSDEEDRTTVVFGNGAYGTRLPTGQENVGAVYRTGIGSPGNVAAEQITQLVTRPLGVRGVINPLRASGGADRENRDQARHNAPLAVMALDRLVSVQDYADFARTFAGIGKASAVRLSDGRRRVVHLTIAGANDIPIDENSELYINLRQALHDFGDPHQPIQVDVRELMLLVLSARVRLLPDYQWESVAPGVRQALLDSFSFDRRELGRDVVLSEVISVIQRVPGVAFVDVDLVDSISETEASDVDALINKLSALVQQSAQGRPQDRIRVEMARFAGGVIQPAQLAFFRPEIPETLLLQELT